MNTPDFHILKEKQEKKLKQVAILIASNSFETSFKQRTIGDIAESIKSIHLQRAIVYRDTENVEQEFKMDLGEEPKVNEEGDVEKVKLEIIALLNEVLESEKKVRMEVITNQSNFEKIKDREIYKEASQDLNDSLSYVLQECMGEDSRSFLSPPDDENKDKYQLTEEDMTNNPDLAKEGLKAGDWIEIPLEALIANISDIKSLEEEEMAKKNEAAAKNKTAESPHSPGPDTKKEDTKTGKKDSKNDKK